MPHIQAMHHEIYLISVRVMKYVYPFIKCQQLRRAKKQQKIKRKEYHKGARKDIIHSIDFMIFSR